MIMFEGVTKRFRARPTARRRRRTVEALREVTLAVPSGEVTAVVGPNGAGKSTLLALVLGFLQPSDGEVTVGGVEPRRYTRDEGAGYLPERIRLPEDWSPGDALRSLARLDGLRRTTAPAEANRWLERLGLADRGRDRVGELSRGMLQRLGIAQALVGGHDLVVLDEPTVGLDPFWRIRLRDLIEEARGRGTTLLIASHDLAEVERVADRAVVLDDGSVQDVLLLRRDESSPPRRYRLTLRNEVPEIDGIFRGVTRPEDAGLEPCYVVDADDPADLNNRLRALLDAGAIILAVTPERPDLETRLRTLRRGKDS